MSDSRDPKMNEAMEDVRELQESAAASFFALEDSLPDNDAPPTPPTAPPRERESEEKGCAWCSAGYVKTPDGVRHAGCCPTCGGGGMLFFPCLAPAAPAASLPPSAGTINSSRTDSSLIDAPPSAETREPDVERIENDGVYEYRIGPDGLQWRGMNPEAEWSIGSPERTAALRRLFASAPPAGSGETEKDALIAELREMLNHEMTANVAETRRYDRALLRARNRRDKWRRRWECVVAMLHAAEKSRDKAIGDLAVANHRLAAHPAGTTRETVGADDEIEAAMCALEEQAKREAGC